MTLEEKIFSLEKLVNSLLSRVTQLESENDRLSQENIILRQENNDLRNRLDKNSNNSHKPLSSDGYSKKPYLPKSEDKRLGGKTGHQGKIFETVTNADTSEELILEVVSVYPPPVNLGMCDSILCPVCDIDLAEENGIDLTEFDVSDDTTLYCEGCDHYVGFKIIPSFGKFTHQNLRYL